MRVLRNTVPVITKRAEGPSLGVATSECRTADQIRSLEEVQNDYFQESPFLGVIYVFMKENMKGMKRSINQLYKNSRENQTYDNTHHKHALHLTLTASNVTEYY